ncbi:hypothetical protein Pelo_10750 [Pelomyxa schiedti]|nr:hypothetical protein Pelo_10750 [Pelomyxa schiedti]
MACCVPFLLMVTFSVVEAWLVLVFLRVDALITFSWYFVFIPFWVCAVGYEVFVWWVFIRWRGMRRQPGHIGAWLWVACIGILIALFTVMVTIQLEDEFTNWYVVFIPLWLALLQLLVVDKNWPENKSQFHDPELEDPHPSVYRYLAILPTNAILAAITFCIILPLKLEDVIHASWAWLLIPWYYIGVLSFLVLMTNILDAHECSQSTFNALFIPSMVLTLVCTWVITLALYLCDVVNYITLCAIPLFIIDFGLMIAPCYWCCCD